MLTSINISTSTLCSANCVFCPNDRGEKIKEKIMSYETAKKIINEIKEYHAQLPIKKIMFGENGDLWLNPKAIEILKYTKKQLPNTPIHIFTNFSLLTPEISFQIITENLVQHIYTNIDSTNETIYYQTKNIKLKNTLLNFKTFIKIRSVNKKELTIPITIYRLPINTYTKCTNAILKKPPIKNRTTVDRPEDEKKTWFDVIKLLDYNDHVENSNPVLWAERPNNTELNKQWECPQLNRIKTEAFIAPDGTWYACCLDSKCELQLGNIIDYSIRLIETSKKRQDLIKQLEQKKYSQIGMPCNTVQCCYAYQLEEQK